MHHQPYKLIQFHHHVLRKLLLKQLHLDVLLYSCKAKHLGVIVSGAVCAKHDDGTELTYKAGDAYSIEPGHDGWVVGDKPAVVYEFHGKWGE